MPKNAKNISLSYLVTNGLLSPYAANISAKNDLDNLDSIISFYKTYGTFHCLRNCSKTVASQMDEIFDTFKTHTLDSIVIRITLREEMRSIYQNLDPKNLEKINVLLNLLLSKLSVRAYNGLLRFIGKIPDLNEYIENIYAPAFSFQRIRNIGTKSIHELEQLNQSLMASLRDFAAAEKNGEQPLNESEYPVVVKEPTLPEIVEAFNPFKKAALSRHIEYLVQNLEVRAMNGYIQVFDNAKTAHQIVATIFSSEFSFGKIKNIGSKTVTELNNFKDNIYFFIRRLERLEDAQLSREYTQLIIKTTFGTSLLHFGDEFEALFDTSGKVKLFKLIQFLIVNKHLLNHKKRELFLTLYTINYEKQSSQIAAELDIGRERLRQLKKDFEAEINDYFRFIQNLKPADIADYGISAETTFKVIGDSFAEKSNAAEGVQYTPTFYSIVFSLLFEETHVVAGYNDTISIAVRKELNCDEYKNYYLIQKEVYAAFHFETFINAINIKTQERITESYELYFEGYLLEFLKDNGKRYLPLIRQVCESILFHEFEMVPQQNGYLHFEINARKSTLKYVLEILEALGEMTKVEDITHALNQKFPLLLFTEQSVRVILQREKEHFIFIGRSSTYGLKKWQEERSNLMGGTIRDIVETYLESKDEPAHISEIMEYVSQFRQTTQLSVKTNLEAEETRRFQFFNAEYIGLGSKRYSNTEQYRRVSGSHFRRAVIKNMAGWDFEAVVRFFVEKFGYQSAQVKDLLTRKIEAGELQLTQTNKIIVCTE